MYQPQSDFGAPGTKRPRTGPKGDGDWTCPNCGNVNFAFRTTCNMRKCSTPKPADGGMPQVAAPAPLYEQAPPPQYIGGPGAPQPVPSYAAAPPSFAAPQMMVNSVAAPYPPAGPPTYAPQGSYVPVMGLQGPGYGAPPPMDSYGISGGPPVMEVISRGPYDQQDGMRKRRGGPESGAEGDWVCPKCGNTNFAFRTVCNMRKCSAPKPVIEPVHTFQGPQGGRFANGGPVREAAAPTPPPGSWSCKACGNLNYPFRTHCNRRNCGVEKPADAPAAPAAPGTTTAAPAATTAA